MVSTLFIVTLICSGGAMLIALLSLVLIYHNINIFKIGKEVTKSMPPQAYDQYYDIIEVSPTKTALLRVPETGFETIFTHLVHMWNGQVGFLNNDQLVYVSESKYHIQPEDPLSFARGDDVFVVNIKTNGYMAKVTDKMKLLEIQTSIERGRIKDYNKTLEDKLIDYGKITREARKAIGWTNQTGTNPLSSFRRPWIGGGGGSFGEEEQDQM